jgi:hypothetical protein
MYKAKPPQNKNTPMKAESIDKNFCCGMEKPVRNPAIAILHQGRNKPKPKASDAVIKAETINFISTILN